MAQTEYLLSVVVSEIFLSALKENTVHLCLKK